MMHASTIRNLLGKHGSFIGRNGEKLGGSLPSPCFRLFKRKEIGSLLMMLSSHTKQSNLIGAFHIFSHLPIKKINKFTNDMRYILNCNLVKCILSCKNKCYFVFKQLFNSLHMLTTNEIMYPIII